MCEIIYFLSLTVVAERREVCSENERVGVTSARVGVTSARVGVTSARGYLASIVTADTECGSARAPWFIHVQPGQRVNISLLDFSLMSDQQSRVDMEYGEEK